MSAFGCHQCDIVLPCSEELERHLVTHDSNCFGIAIEKSRIGDGKDFERLKCHQCDQEYIWPKRIVERVKNGNLWCWACRFPVVRPVFNEI